MREIMGVIFDLDGVIVDTAKYHYLAWKSLADELNINFKEEDNELLKGVSRMASLEIILKMGNVDFDEEKKLVLAKRKNDRYIEYINKINETELLKGVLDYILELKAKGMKIALGSASKNAELILKNTKITDIFDAIADGNNVTLAKPDPEVFLKAAELIGVAPENCVVFEDSIAGIEAAKRANMLVIGIGDKKTLYEADTVVRGLYEAPIVFTNI